MNQPNQPNQPAPTPAPVPAPAPQQPAYYQPAQPDPTQQLNTLQAQVTDWQQRYATLQGQASQASQQLQQLQQQLGNATNTQQALQAQLQEAQAYRTQITPTVQLVNMISSDPRFHHLIAMLPSIRTVEDPNEQRQILENLVGAQQAGQQAALNQFRAGTLPGSATQLQQPPQQPAPQGAAPPPQPFYWQGQQPPNQGTGGGGSPFPRPPRQDIAIPKDQMEALRLAQRTAGYDPVAHNYYMSIIESASVPSQSA